MAGESPDASSMSDRFCQWAKVGDVLVMSEGAAVVFGPIVLKYGRVVASKVGAARNCDPRPSEVAEVGWLLGVTGVCSPGYLWRKVEGGYRCAGEGHFMSNEELGIEEPKSEEASQTLLKEQESEEAEQVDQEEETQERIQERLKATRVCAAGYW